MTSPFFITADEVNYLIHSYFEDSGMFQLELWHYASYV